MNKSNQPITNNGTVRTNNGTPIGILPGREVTVSVESETGVLTVDLNRNAARRIASSVAGIQFPTDGQEHAYVSELRRIGFESLPPDFLSVAAAVRAGTLAPTAILFRGFEYEEVASSPAPGENSHKVKASDLSENQLVLLGAVLGEPYGMAGEGARLVNDLIPNQKEIQMLTGNGSALRLGFHTENAAHRWIYRDRDLSPQGLLLAGICVPAENPPLTRIANGRMAARKLAAENPELYKQLWDPCVRVSLPIRQRKPGISRLPASPILSGKPGMETVTAAYYGDMMEPLAEQAVAAFEAALDASAIGLLVQPGVVVYVPNGYSLHSRDGFIAKFDEDGRANRWLQRIFVTARLDAFQIGRAVSERRFELAD